MLAFQFSSLTDPPVHYLTAKYLFILLLLCFFFLLYFIFLQGLSWVCYRLSWPCLWFSEICFHCISSLPKTTFLGLSLILYRTRSKMERICSHPSLISFSPPPMFYASSSAQITLAERGRNSSGFGVSSILGKLICAIFTFFFALGWSLLSHISFIAFLLIIGWLVGIYSCKEFRNKY